MVTYIIGDLHGNANNEMYHTFNGTNSCFTKEDIIIQLGDFGFFFESIVSKESRFWLDWLTSQPFTFCFIDGNHENFPLMNQLFFDCEIFGSYAKKYVTEYGEIYWLQRGECYNINGKKILAIGGAESTDKQYRDITNWWQEETLSYSEEQKVINTCKLHNWSFDYILSHTAPSFVVNELVDHFLFTKHRIKDPVSEFLNELANNLDFKEWHFGHFHVNWTYNKQYFCHYKKLPYKLI